MTAVGEEVGVRVPAALRQLCGGEQAVPVPVAGPVSVGALLDALASMHPALERRVRDELGRARTHVNLFVGEDNIRDLAGLATEVPPGSEVTIIAAVSGG